MPIRNTRRFKAFVVSGQLRLFCVIRFTRGEGKKGREWHGREGTGTEGNGMEGNGMEGRGREGKGGEGKGRVAICPPYHVSREGKGKEGNSQPWARNNSLVW